MILTVWTSMVIISLIEEDAENKKRINFIGKKILPIQRWRVNLFARKIILFMQPTILRVGRGSIRIQMYRDSIFLILLSIRVSVWSYTREMYLNHITEIHWRCIDCIAILCQASAFWYICCKTLTCTRVPKIYHIKPLHNTSFETKVSDAPKHFKLPAKIKIIMFQTGNEAERGWFRADHVHVFFDFDDCDSLSLAR